MVAKPNITWPTHLDLPETDGLPVENDFQAPQSRLLTSSIEPILEQIHPTGDYFIGEDVGIYWKATQPPLNGCKAPDWYYVAGCRRLPPGEYRRSFVLWDEGVAPTLVIEFVSGNGDDEHDDTPGTGKFWVYRRGIRAAYYAIHDPMARTLKVHRLDGTEYRPLNRNQFGVFEIVPLNIALGHWTGKVGNHELTWLRFFRMDGSLLLSDRERADQAAAMLAKLKKEGIDPPT